MKYWLLSLPRPDMEHCIKIGIFGAAQKGTLGKLCRGDKVVCYVTKECKIIAVGSAKSDYYIDDQKVFRSAGDFPDRFDFEAKIFPSSGQVDIRTLVDDLSFVTNKAYWSVFFRLSNREIPKTDYDLICRKTSS